MEYKVIPVNSNLFKALCADGEILCQGFSETQVEKILQKIEHPTEKAA